ncbi:hypothetical protein C7120_10825 [Prevotella sp. oral taxon 376]|uniref:glycosyltransferase family 2 protein n=1 Tax=Prevotella sp. oral taxon 376 TaxID=712466 RepID=UPI000D1E80A8|nr:glycosyltransferase family 2 protein [Prevotella sp. oral taxon 376]PTL32775.1 hypothetical protein C7120_10825 [Prevotella sp. oral taxon 376]
MKSYHPLISIIVPIYNVEQYIHFCLDSLKNQTYPNLEIFLIDDGSTDNSGKICDSYSLSDSRFHIIHQENKGVSEARNTGLRRACGEYIYFVDGDDFIIPTAIEVLYNAIIKSKASFSMGLYKTIYAPGTHTHTHTHTLSLSLSLSLQNHQKFKSLIRTVWFMGYLENQAMLYYTSLYGINYTLKH